MSAPRVAAVIVTYRNPEMLRELIDDLKAQRRPPERIVVIDNGGGDAAAPAGVEWTSLPENTGSAGGFYEGVKRAATDADFILTLDDDVRPAKDCVSALLAGFAELSGGRKLGAVRAVGAAHAEKSPTPLEIAPWRGTLFSAAAVREIGLPDPGYFIYGEDLEYSLRLRRHGYEIFWAPAAVCVERRQGKTDDRLLGRKVAIYPSAFRLYYAFRNEIRIYLDYGKPIALLRTILYALKVWLYLAVREGAAGRAKMGAVAAGLADGFYGVKGKNPRYAPEAP